MSSVSKPDASPRRGDLDILRALIVLGLVFFHTARIFDPGWFYVKDSAINLPLTVLVSFTAVWAMPLMFFVSGMGAWYSLRRRSGIEFARERFTRLLVPFLFGLVVIVPPQRYLALAFHTGYAPSYLAYYPTFFNIHLASTFPWFFQGDASAGSFEPAHLWFLYLLFVFSLLALPLFLYLKGRGRTALDWLADWSERGRLILLLGLPVALLEALLRDEATGGWNGWAYLLFVVYGFVLASDPRFTRALARHAWVAVILAAVILAPGFAWYMSASQIGVDLGTSGDLAGAAFRVLKSVDAWLWIAAICGLPARAALIARQPRLAAGRRARVIAYANEAVLPFYVLHQTVIVAVGYFVVRWPVDVAVRYVAIALPSLAISLALYEIVRRIPATRFLFGMKPLAAPEPGYAVEPTRA